MKNRALKFRYFWKGEWFYIDLYDKNVRAKLEAYECIYGASILYQYTGLGDMNGKKIYEGDILKWTASLPRRKGEIFYNAVEYFVGGTLCGFRVRNKSTHIPLTENRIINANAKIVGNLCENPKLINKTKK